MLKLILLLSTLGLAEAVQEAPEIVEEIGDVIEMLDKDETRTNAEKFALAVVDLESTFDEHCDWIPGWKDFSEEKRDRMTKGLVEWLLTFVRMGEKAGKRPAKHPARTKRAFQRILNARLKAASK